MLNVKRLFLIAMLCGLSLSLFASTNYITSNNQQFIAARELLKKGAKARDINVLNRARKELMKLYASSGRDYLTAYSIAQSNTELVEIYQNRKNQEKASFHIEEALKYLNESIKLNDKFSDSHCLLAATLGQKIRLNGVFAGLVYQKKTSRELQIALELDPNNADVYVGFGISYVATPYLFGGDLEKGIENLNKALELDSSKYQAYVWLGKAYRKKGQAGKAKEMLLKALEYRPNDIGVKKELACL